VVIFLVLFFILLYPLSLWLKKKQMRISFITCVLLLLASSDCVWCVFAGILDIDRAIDRYLSIRLQHGPGHIGLGRRRGDLR